MYTHNGKEKLVMACSIDVEGSIANLDMEWMVAQENREPFFLEYKEKRFLHYEHDVCHQFRQYFGHVEILHLANRRWLFAKEA